jgi:hypothetical protein
VALDSITGAIVGGLLPALVPSGLLKAVLGVILITSSVKVFGKHRF